MMNNDALALALDQALETDINGMIALRHAMQEPPLREALIRAVETIYTTKGRLVISGLGKSGHIGRKLAATFASTGTASYFVHGAETSHGDLGMIQSSDVVVVLTWSGGTSELADLVAYTRRFAIPLIALTGNAQGRIARQADIILELPQVDEACPLNLAPTTTSLMQMAIGDAVAIGLLQMRGFTADAFRNFHPGGRLGAALSVIDDIAVTGDALPLIDQAASIRDMIEELSLKSLGIVGVTDAQGALIGVVTDGDIRRYMGKSTERTMHSALVETRASEIMTPHPVTLSPGLLAGQALSVLQEHRISGAFIVANDKPKAVLTTLQLIQAGVG